MYNFNMSNGKKNESDNIKKLKEISNMMKKFGKSAGSIEAQEQLELPSKDSNPNFNVVESNRTLTYGQAEWEPYGKLVRYS